MFSLVTLKRTSGNCFTVLGALFRGSFEQRADTPPVIGYSIGAEPSTHWCFNYEIFKANCSYYCSCVGEVRRVTAAVLLTKNVPMYFLVVVVVYIPRRCAEGLRLRSTEAT